MEAAFKTYNLADGRSIELHHDPDPMNPRKEFDNLGTMVCFHKRHCLGDEADGIKGHGIRYEDHIDWDAMEDHIKQENPDCVILRLFLFDHSGITINTTGFSCPWDSGQVGFIFISREKINEEYGEHGRTDEQIEEYLRGEVALYDQYLTGDVCGYILRDKPCSECEGEGKELDSCWGFFGDNPFENGIADHLKDADRKELETLV